MVLLAPHGHELSRSVSKGFENVQQPRKVEPPDKEYYLVSHVIKGVLAILTSDY